MAAWDVPSGRAFDGRSAVYLGPTPWQATSPDLANFNRLQTAGPVEMPWVYEYFHVNHRGLELTRRPGSVEARAKINVMGLQGPSRSSSPPVTDRIVSMRATEGFLL